jgi:hypothetical protein
LPIHLKGKLQMTRQEPQPFETQPIYTKLWDQLKNFPQGLAVGSGDPPQVSGPAAAALISAAFSAFILMVSQHLTLLFKPLEPIVWSLGYWIPGSKTADRIYGDIGSYSGKETVMLISWLLSWAILSQLWKHQPIRTRTIFFWLFTFFVAATVMNWHPLFPYMPLMPK